MAKEFSNVDQLVSKPRLKHYSEEKLSADAAKLACNAKKGQAGIGAHLSPSKMATSSLYLSLIFSISLTSLCIIAIIFSFIYFKGTLLGFGLSFSSSILLYEVYVALKSS